MIVPLDLKERRRMWCEVGMAGTTDEGNSNLGQEAHCVLMANKGSAWNPSFRNPLRP